MDARVRYLLVTMTAIAAATARQCALNCSGMQPIR